MKTLSTILSAAVLLQFGVCTNFAVAADTVSSIDSQPVEVSMASCGTKRTHHHVARQVRSTARPQTKSYSATSTTTETLPAQTINVPIQQPAAVAPACPTVITQPAVVQECAVQPAIVSEHRNVLPYLLVGGALLATAIAVPLAVTHHHHRNNNQALLRQQQLLLFSRATP